MLPYQKKRERSDGNCLRNNPAMHRGTDTIGGRTCILYREKEGGVKRVSDFYGQGIPESERRWRRLKCQKLGP